MSKHETFIQWLKIVIAISVVCLFVYGYKQISLKLDKGIQIITQHYVK
jgi:hypothetical protein